MFPARACLTNYRYQIIRKRKNLLNVSNPVFKGNTEQIFEIGALARLRDLSSLSHA